MYDVLFLFLSQFFQTGVFEFCRLASAQMTFFLVDVQDLSDFFVQTGVDLRQQRRQIFVYRRFTDAEYRCGIAYGALMFYDVFA